MDLSPDQLLTTTRSVRKRLDLDRPVPLDLVRECLTIALQAPSGSNRQNWHWIVVTDPDRRAAIGAVYRRAAYAYFAAGGPAVADPARAATQERVRDSAAHLADHMGQVPVLVLGCLGGRLPEGNQAGFWGSLFPAAWSYMLAARARGLGTAWTSLHLAYEAEVAAILGLPASVHQGVLIPTAYYTGTGFRPAGRLPLDEVIHIDAW